MDGQGVHTVILVLLLKIAVADNDFTCPSSCDCSYISQDLTRKLELTCFTQRVSVEQFNFWALPSIDEPFRLKVYCDSGMTPTYLNDYMFSSLNKMEFLFFRNCKFSYIHRNVFEGLPALRELYIDKASNFHLQVHPRMFESIPGVESVTFTNSGIENMPKLCGIKSLRYLNISSNSLTSLEDVGLDCGSETILGYLRLIDISNNDLKNISLLEDFGETFLNVDTIYADKNRITFSYTDNPFGKLKYLRHLDLSENNIDLLPENLLRRTNELHEINLSNNHITYVPETFFSYSKYLLQIELQNNDLDDDVWEQLQRVPNLMYLDLSNNNITELNEKVLADLTELGFLDLSYNNINTIPVRIFQNQIRLQNLRLGGNHLHTIDNDTLNGLLYLSYLDLHGNKLYSVHSDLLVPVTVLTHLNISGNFLQEVPSLERQSTLLVMDASNNFITELDEDLFIGQKNIRDIDLSRNQIAVIPDGLLLPCETLENLDLSYNRIEYVHPSMFMDLSAQRVRLNNNKIKDIGKTFANMVSLNELFLSANEIRDTIQRYMFPESLVMLDLSYNEIVSVRPYAFDGLNKIRMVDLRFNKIRTLTDTALAVSTGLYAQTGFLIDENPLQCDCNLLWLKKWDQTTHGPIIVNLNTTRCGGAYNFPESAIFAVPEDRFLCKYTNMCPLQCRCCDFLACDCKYECPDKCSCFRSADYSSLHYVDCAYKNLTRINRFIPRLATKIDLSGNDLGEVQSHSFIGMTNLSFLFLNNSNIHVLGNRSFAGLSDLKSLYLDHNYIEELQSDMFAGVTTLTALYLDHNEISYIESGVFDHLASLTTLTLSDNNLKQMNDYLSHLAFNIRQLTMFSNPWNCDCILYFSAKHNPMAFIQESDWAAFYGPKINCSVLGPEQTIRLASIEEYQAVCEVRGYDFIKNNKKIEIEDFIRESSLAVDENNSVDSDEETFAVVAEDTGEPFRDNRLKIFIPVILGSTLIFILVLMVVCRREIIRFWIFTKFNCRNSREQEILYDKDRNYDAFVTYCSRDEIYVIRELVLRLERGKRKYHLLVDHRDIVPGNTVSKFLENGIRMSHRTILVLSSDFINEVEKLDHVVRCLKQDSIRRLIVIVLGEIDTLKLDPVLRTYLKTNNCIKYGDSWFWKKLSYCLPEPSTKHLEIPRAKAHPYASTDLVRFSSAMMDNQAYEEPISISSRPLPTITEYVPTSHTYHYTTESEHSHTSNIYEEIKDQPHPPGSETSGDYQEPWSQIYVGGESLKGYQYTSSPEST